MSLNKQEQGGQEERATKIKKLSRSNGVTEEP